MLTNHVKIRSLCISILFLLLSIIFILSEVVQLDKRHLNIHFNLKKVRSRLSSSSRKRLEEQSRIVFTDGSHFQTYKLLIQANGHLETTVKCIGPFYNQSCLFKNLYYKDDTFWIFSTKKLELPMPDVRVGAFYLPQITPNRRRFYSYIELEEFVRYEVTPMVISNLTVFFDLPWISNIAHALFDGLYPIYLALIRFPPKHLQPFRILLNTFTRIEKYSYSPFVYERFGGLSTLNATLLRELSSKYWFAFEELVMGSGNMCQRCLQPNLQLPGGIEMNGSRLFRERMYKQHGLLQPVTRYKHSAEMRDLRKPLRAYVIDNKRFTREDRVEIDAAITEINNDTDEILKFQKGNNETNEDLPLVYVSYIKYAFVKMEDDGSLQLNSTEVSSTDAAKKRKMTGHLQLLKDMDIHVTGPGTGQLFQTFLSDGSVTINLGGLRTADTKEHSNKYTSFMEQYVTAGTPYIKGFYYPINERPKGIKREIVVKLIQDAARIIRKGFVLPVQPIDNLAPDGQLFKEMCELDVKFCKTVTERSEKTSFWCIDTWPEDIVNESGPWSPEGIDDNGKQVFCPSNRKLLNDLRLKYKINFNAFNTLT